MAAQDPSVGEPNTPDWEEVPGSPFTASAAADLSGAISVSGEEYLFRMVNVYNESSVTAASWALTLSGVTSGYEYVDEGNSRTTAAAQFDLISNNGLSGIAGTIEIADWTHATGAMSGSFEIHTRDTANPAIVRGYNPSVDDITSFTLSHPNGAAITGKVEVYVR